MPSLGFHCSRDFVCDFCVVWVIQNELLKFFISQCELIWMLLLELNNMIYVN